MSLVVSHMKAQKVLERVLSGELTSLESVISEMGNDPYNALWAKNIWEYHTTEAPSVDLKTRLPSKEKIKEFKLVSDNKYYIVKAKTLEDAKAKVEEITSSPAEETNTSYKVEWIKVLNDLPFSESDTTGVKNASILYSF